MKTIFNIFFNLTDNKEMIFDVRLFFLLILQFRFYLVALSWRKEKKSGIGETDA